VHRFLAQWDEVEIYGFSDHPASNSLRFAKVFAKYVARMAIKSSRVSLSGLGGPSSRSTSAWPTLRINSSR
jgi:hypothetical protein